MSRCLIFKRSLTGKGRGREAILPLRGVYGSSTQCRTDIAEEVGIFISNFMLNSVCKNHIDFQKGSCVQLSRKLDILIGLILPYALKRGSIPHVLQQAVTLLYKR